MYRDLDQRRTHALIGLQNIIMVRCNAVMIIIITTHECLSNIWSSITKLDMPLTIEHAQIIYSIYRAVKFPYTEHAVSGLQEAGTWYKVENNRNCFHFGSIQWQVVSLSLGNAVCQHFCSAAFNALYLDVPRWLLLHLSMFSPRRGMGGGGEGGGLSQGKIGV